MASADSKLDMTLDQLAAQSRSGAQSGRRGARGGRRGGGSRGGRRQGDAATFTSAGPVRHERTHHRAEPYQRTSHLHQTAAEAKQTITHGQKLQTSCTILVANLDPSLRETDLEFFKESGSIKDVHIFYDKNGRSLGQAEVVFEQAHAAEKAAVEFDQAEINGRPISVKAITEVGRQLTVSKVAPPAPVPRSSPAAAAAPRRGPRPTSSSFARGGRRGGATRGRGGRGGRPQGQGQQRQPKAAVSQASLDQDLDQYKTAPSQ